MTDLHTHTTYSDGSLTVEELLKDAVENNIDIMSITDHDTTAVTRYTSNIITPEGITIIPGIEFSAESYYLNKKTRIHMLGYGYNHMDAYINRGIDNKYDTRGVTHKEYISDLIKKFPFLSTEMFEDFEYGRFGWIRKLILDHISDQLKEEDLKVLTQYLLENPAVYKNYSFDAIETIDMIHKAGGYAVFAHPYQTKLNHEELDLLTRYLKENNLDGIETYHAAASLEDREYAHLLSQKYELYETGGSDFHCYKDEIMIGHGVPQEVNNLQLVKKIIREGKTL